MSNGATHMFKNGLALFGHQNGFRPNGMRWDLNMPGHMISKSHKYLRVAWDVIGKSYLPK